MKSWFRQSIISTSFCDKKTKLRLLGGFMLIMFMLPSRIVSERTKLIFAVLFLILRITRGWIPSLKISVCFQLQKLSLNANEKRCLAFIEKWWFPTCMVFMIGLLVLRKFMPGTGHDNESYIGNLEV